jgi:CheY-like chemotaxis protein
MENQRPEEAAEPAAFGRRKAMPRVCLADAEQPMRTFLGEALRELGFITCECAQVNELGAVLDSQPPDLVIIGLSAGGIEACAMLELLAAEEFDGKVVVLGPRVSPMVAAVRELGATLGLAMLPLLPTPFSKGDVRDCVCRFVPIEAGSVRSRRAPGRRIP